MNVNNVVIKLVGHDNRPNMGITISHQTLIQRRLNTYIATTHRINGTL